tara:strand:+ start:373 stop:573 length:201 start_codon:yes stop_codon:yes gene_type:complete
MITQMEINKIKQKINHIEDEKLVTEYISSLNDLEIKALNIAIDHLKTSFNIMKSIGYIKWLKNQTK